MSFSADLTKFVTKTGGNLDQVVQKVGMDLTRGVIKRTPVDTGRARANWQVGQTLPTDSINATDKQGSATISAASGAIKQIKAGGVFYIANNVSYIIPLEYGGSKQAPYGMVRLTVKMYERFLRNACRKLS